MSRRRRITLVAGLLVVVALAAVLLFRHGLIAYVIENALDRRGFPEARISVTRLATDGAVIESIDLGAGAPAVDRVVISYELGELLSGRIRLVDIEGLALEIDLSRPDALDRLFALLDGAAEPGGQEDGGALPRISIDDAVVVFTGTGAGPVTIAFRGWADPSAEADVAQADGDLTGPDAQGHVALAVSRIADGFRLDIGGDGEAALASLPWPAGFSSPPQSGTISATFDGDIPLEADGSIDPGTLLEKNAKITVRIDVAAASFPTIADRIDMSAALSVEPRDGALVVDLTAPATIAAEEIAADLLAPIDGSAVGDFIGDTRAVRLSLGKRTSDLPLILWRPGEDGGTARIALAFLMESGETAASADITGEIEHDPAYRPRLVTVSDAVFAGRGLTAGPIAQGSFDWRGSGSMRDGAYALEGPLLAAAEAIVVGGNRFEATTFDGNVKLSGRGDALDATLLEPAHVSLARPPRLGALRLNRPVDLRLESGSVVYRDATIEAEIRAGAKTITGSIARDGADALEFAATAGPIDLSISAAEQVSGRIDSDGSMIDFPGLGIRIENIRATTPFGGAGPARGTLSAVVRDTTATTLSSPLTIEFETALETDAIDATGRASLANGKARIPLKARYRFDNGRGKLTAGPVDLAFEKGGLQPADLSPRLSTLKNVSGAVTSDAALSFGAGRDMNGTATISFDALSLDMPAARVQGLSGSIKFTDINPPTTEPDTEIKIDKVVTGVTIADVAGRFQVVSAAGTPMVELAHAEGRLADGVITIDNARIPLDAAMSEFDVRVRRLSLAQLFEEWAVEGLSGTGHLSGTIPVRFGPDGVAITAGRLDAAESGVLRVDLGSSRDVLAQQGEQVALMVQVLENFQYKLLGLGIDRPTAGDLELAIQMEGQNPDVLEGYPFRFNITLSGDLEPVLDALQQGEGLSTDLLRDAIQSVQ
ncbi:MAG: hypothetical protein GY791_12745 [Alphaproteobacteria bacterium]|nr:hypothetical protein [Alphaproteobacteria bacterium]